MDKNNIFHAYDIRGVYPGEFGLEDAYRIGWAFAKYLKTDLKNPPSASGGGLPLEVVVGMDMRGSSPFLAREVIRGLNEQGVDVAEIGRVPTPAFYYAVAFKDFPAGLKITADPANCMGALELEELFQRIDCDPIKINWELNGNMPVHEANPIKSETLRQLQAVIKNEG